MLDPFAEDLPPSQNAMRLRSLYLSGLTLAACSWLAPGSLARPLQSNLVTTLPGEVVDLTLDADEKLLFCTDGGDVGRVEPDGAVTLLVDGTSGAFPTGLRAVHPTPGGAIAVIDAFGDIYHVPSAGGSPTLVYQDLFLINEPTDLVVDAGGVHAIPVQTISSGYRAVAWIDLAGSTSPADTRWSYYLIEHQPVSLAPDPQTGGLLLADAAGGGALRAMTTGQIPETSPVDAVTAPGVSVSALDGDLATEFDGSAWWVAGNRLYHHDRIAGLTTLIDTGAALRRGVAVAPSSPGSGSTTGHSVWFVEGAFPTELREIVDAEAPADVFADPMGTVPDRGEPILSYPGLNAQALTPEPGGTLLVGGDIWGASPNLRRIDPVTKTIDVVASDADGLSSRVEGIQTRRDGSIYVSTDLGDVFRVQEDPLQVTPVFVDGQNQLNAAKGLTVTRDGTIYQAERGGYNWGRVWRVDPGGALSVVTSTEDTRGAVADPFADRVLVSEWVSPGFGGRVAVLDEVDGELEPFGEFDGLNFSNGSIWGDGDLFVDCLGAVYTSCEDGFAVHRYDRQSGQRERIGAGYLNRPSGLAIAPSRPTTASDTGWSLYVSEWNNLWELPGLPAPAPHVLDRTAPPIGAPVGFVSPAFGAPRFAVLDPDGGAALVGTDSAHLLRLPLDGSPSTLLAGPSEGLSGDLVDAAPASNGDLYVANSEGVVFTLSAVGGWIATTTFDDAADDLENVRAIALLENGDLAVLDRPAATPQAGRLFVLSGGVLTDRARNARGEHVARCPLSGDLFTTQRGQTTEARGEVLRVDLSGAQALVGNVVPADLSSPRGYSVGDRAGAITFAGNGDFFVAAGAEGRIHHFDRSTAQSTPIAGSYTRPVDLFLASGSAGVAGIDGTSLFVLDGYALYEHGVEGLPVAPQAAPTGGGGGIDMAAGGLVDFGGTTPLIIQRAEAAGETYFVLPGFSGKGDGFPLALLGDGADPRILPLTADSLWFQFLLPPTFLHFQGVLDGSGLAPATAGIAIPSDPALESAGVFMDMQWIGIDLSAPNGTSFVGGTTQLFFGP